jgi:hypothetical protein
MSTTGTKTSATATASSGSSFTGIPVKIANTLSVPLDIYDVFNPAATGQTAPYLYTKLGTIAAGATGTVTTIRQVSQLEAMYTGTIDELQGWYYHQFPIKLMSGTQLSFGNPPPLSYTIAESDRQSMIQSFLFHKFAMANPDSALTKNLNAALKSTDSTAVNTFFAGTANFKNCTLSSWNAVMTWLTMFTSGWQGPYYLYEAAPANPPASYVPALIGTLNVVSTAAANTATLALCSQDSTGKVQPLTPAQGSTVAMAGDGTMVDQNPGQDVTATLTPVWMNTIQTTMTNGQPTTSYISGPVLTGTVAGNKVVSTQTVMPLASQSQSGSGSSSSSGSSSATFGTICQVVGLIVGLVMLYEIAEKRFASKSTAEEKAKAEATSESDLQSKLKTADEAPENNASDVFTKDASKINTDSTGVADGYAKASGIQQKQVLTDTVDAQEQSLGQEINDQLENGYTPTQEFENAVGAAEDSFGTARQEIADGNLPGASKTISEAGSSMQQTLDQSAEAMQQSEVEALKSSSEAVTTAADQADALSKAQEQYEETSKSAAEDSGAPKEDVSPDTEEIPEAEL